MAQDYSSLAEGVLIRRLFGDSNGDGTVNLDDYFAFSSAYGTSVGDPGFVPAFDGNCDSTINLDDFFAFSSRFGLGF